MKVIIVMNLLTKLTILLHVRVIVETKLTHHHYSYRLGWSFQRTQKEAFDVYSKK